jgi:hypothetical protein
MDQNIEWLRRVCIVPGGRATTGQHLKEKLIIIAGDV